MARRRHTPEQIHHQAAGGRGGFGAGAVGGAGLQGAWGDGADVLALAQEGCGGMRVAPGQAAGAVGGVKDARPGAGGGRSDGRQPGLCGKRPEGGSCGPDASAGGPSRRRSGRWRSRWCGACRVLGQPRFHSALPCPLAGRRGGALEPRTVGLATSFGRYGYRRIAALPPSLGAGRSTTSGRGRIWRQEGPGVPCRQPKARPSVAGRRVPDPAAPYLPQLTSGPTGLVGDPNPRRTALAAAGRGRARHTRQTPLGDRGGPARSRADKCALQSHRAVRCPRASRAPGRTMAPSSPTRPCRVGLAAPVTRPPLHLARQPQRGNGYTREGFNGKLRDELHRPRDLLHPPGSPGSRSRVGARPTAQLRPHSPARVPPTST